MKPAGPRRAPIHRRIAALGKLGWRAVAAVLGVAGSGVAIATYLWPDEPENAAAIEATVVGYRSLADFRSATGSAGSAPVARPARDQEPLLGLHVAVTELVGYGGEELTWSWALLRRGPGGVEQVPSEPRGGRPHYVTASRQEDSFRLEPAAIFPEEQGPLFVRVELRRESDGAFLAEDCSNVVVLRGGAFADGAPVAC